ncbi:hypothetical protein AVEN_190743-1 [Araneus ventricosus]|uniref:DDE-1 domain-containing protein n=1 Tax=Araneus ventricosus TaxID=182803 RepID=A0A4Y2QD38_ARAVE|nr:hypothetical protein AVEN_255814-1 [Araneus ventricosus]GBN60206.1 hypothetical protein AVEN_60433-1 [Araneus ventricosus]GBN60219.1 hypothetical protein AVEN_160221-1 [Araneus ventricosus]GBN60233.1 hypothetical protein AVEN_190743-1 [Araneus ventricosus]
MVRAKQKVVEPNAEMKVIKLRLLTPVTRELHYGRTTISLLKISVLNVPKGGFKCHEAAHLLTSSWNRISADAIRNCFAHGRLCEALEEKLSTVIEPPEAMQKEEYEQWTFIDEVIPVAVTLTDLEICRAVCEQVQAIEGDDSDGDECVEGNPPTNAEMRQALDILNHGMQYHSTNFRKQYEYKQYINELLRNNSRQAAINEIFNRYF